MEQQREGLNFVPMLSQSLTPPSSARSRISLNINRSQRSVVYYNGNYEGDSSMFRGKGYEWERLSLVDSESDKEDLSKLKSNQKSNANATQSSTLFWHLIEFLMLKFLKPKISEKVLERCEHFRQSSLCHMLTKWAQLFELVVTYSFWFGLVLTKNLAALGSFIWKQRVVFHNLVRRLLWRLTLAKCTDRYLFLYVLLTLPILLALSLIGFIISICGGLKDLVHHGIHTLSRI